MTCCARAFLYAAECRRFSSRRAPSLSRAALYTSRHTHRYDITRHYIIYAAAIYHAITTPTTYHYHEPFTPTIICFHAASAFIATPTLLSPLYANIRHHYADYAVATLVDIDEYYYYLLYAALELH